MEKLTEKSLIGWSLIRETDQSFHDDFTIKNKNILYLIIFSLKITLFSPLNKLVEEFEIKQIKWQKKS